MDNYVSLQGREIGESKGQHELASTNPHLTSHPPHVPARAITSKLLPRRLQRRHA